jgi:ABC-2 type transport system permease protein
MKLFLRELKNNSKPLLFWCLGMIALVASGMAKFSAYSTTGQSMSALISQFPMAIQTVFGLNGFDLSKAIGFYGVLFIYIALMAAIHAVLLGTDILVKEERDKTSEFLFVKPISRFRIITSKLLAGLMNILVLNIATFASSILFVDYFAKSCSDNPIITVLCLGLLLLQLLFFFFGTAIAAIVKRPKSAGSVATALVLFTFILTFIININKNLANLKYLSPFRYFDAKTIMVAGQLNILYVFISMAIIAISIYVTYSCFVKKDLTD